MPILFEASERLAEFVPSERRTVQELVRNPEDEEGEGTLFAVTQTALGWDEIRPQLERLRWEWLIDASRRVGGRTNVDVDYF